MIAAVRRQSLGEIRRPAKGRLLGVVRAFVYASAALLFLSAAATVEVGFTVRVSHALVFLACALGVVAVVDGWRRLPSVVVVGATGVLGSYALAAALGDDKALPGTTRSGDLRELVYLGDLMLGLALVGLVVGVIVSRRELHRVAVALAIGAAVASAYAIYQWFAQQHGWPLADVNNTADSNGVTSGGLQGDGFLGRERARGTFLEPHFLAAFLSSLVPVVAALCLTAKPVARILLGVIVAALLLALLFTSSAPSWAVVVLALTTAAALWAAVVRRPLAFAATAAALVFAASFVTVFFTSPERLGSLTGRSGQQMRLTTDFRTTTWSRVGDIWSTRPVLGYGPGQSSVQLTAASDYSGIPEHPPRPVALQSAQGLWAASLIDAGVVGFGMWLVLLGAALAIAFATVIRRPSILTAGVALAALAATASSQVAGDRLDLRVWLLLGLALAAAQQGQQPERH